MVGQDMLSLASQKTDYTTTTDTRCSSKRDFFACYESYCKKHHVHPLKEVKTFSTGPKCSLELMVDKIKFGDWIPLLKALSSDRSLHSITFKSRIQLGTGLQVQVDYGEYIAVNFPTFRAGGTEHHQGEKIKEVAVVAEDIVTERGARELKKGVVLFTTYMLQKFTAACVECIQHSDALRLFHTENIPIPTDFIRLFAEGISKTRVLQKLLMVGCQLGDEGCQIISESLKKVPSIHTLDLSSNDITYKGAKNIANLIKFQGITRYNECWKHSLRAREVNTEAIPGLRRFSINDNHEVTDKGLKYIVEALADDNWIKAIDMQKCGITDRGCSMVSKLLETNKDIVVFDLRKNNVVDIMAIPSIMNQLNDNKKLNDGAEYKWIFIPNASSSEDSSSGGASSSSYNLTYTNEKVAKYVETVNIEEKHPVRAIQSDSTLKDTTDDASRFNRQVKLFRPIQRSASSTVIKSALQSRIRGYSSNEASVTGVKKRVTSPATNSLLRVNVQKYANQVRKPSQPNLQRQLSTGQLARPAQNGSQLKSTQSDITVKGVEPGGPRYSKNHRNERFSKTVVREEMLKQTLEVEKTHGKSAGAEQLPALDSSGTIEQALEELFKSWESSNNERQESRTSLNHITQDLTPSLSLEDFKVDGNPKPNRRIKETKKVCCLYFNRLEDGYEE